MQKNSKIKKQKEQEEEYINKRIKRYHDNFNYDTNKDYEYTFKRESIIKELENKIKADDIFVPSMKDLDRELKKLEKLQLPKEVFNSESRLFISDVKKFWNKEGKLFKIFYRYDDIDYMRKKNEIILKLIDNHELLSEKIPELILPEARVKYSKNDVNVLGYSMPYIKENINLSMFLNNPDIDIREKIGLLKEIGIILDKVHNIHELKNKFYLGDLHEDNFIFDIKEKKVKVVDMDGAIIDGSLPFGSRYLVGNHNILSPELSSKYFIDDDAFNKVDKNSDNLCYITTILNTITLGNVQKLSIEDFYRLLQELIDNKYPKSLIDEFAKIYIAGIDNTNVYYLLDDLNNKYIHNFDYEDFQRRINPRN